MNRIAAHSECPIVTKIESANNNVLHVRLSLNEEVLKGMHF